MKLKFEHIFFLILSCFLAVGAVAQNGSISGKVTDTETKEPLFGATVFIVGTYKGASVDFDGNYKIEDVKAGDYTIRVSYVGYADKVLGGVSVKAGTNKVVNFTLESRATSLKEVVIEGDAAIIDLESAKSEIRVSSEDIKEMNVRNVQDIVSMQAGVNVTPDGLQIRGGRVYETQYLVDGINAQDPLAGTGFGVNVGAGSIGDVSVVTGGAGAEFGDGSSGVVSTRIKEGGEKFTMAGSWQRDNLGFNVNQGTAWNTDVAEVSLSTPIPGTGKKLRLFASADFFASDDYFRIYADQLHSSLLPKNDSMWAPRQNNKWSQTVKLSYQVKPGTKITFTNQHSLAVNQNTRSLQIIGFNAVVQPGLQYDFALDPDAATTYTHQSNLSVINLNHFFNNSWNMNVSVGRLFTNLRADANGRPFRDETVDQVYDPQSIVSDPVSVFNPDGNVVFVNAGPGLTNNGGISTVWHDHYASEWTTRVKFSYYPKNEHHEFSFGAEHKELEYQWVDVTRPWVGAPIQINDSVSTPSISVGSSNDIWKVRPANGGVFFQDKISYKGINAVIGLRYNYWAYGKFADEAVANPDAPVLDQIREDYVNSTVKIFGRRWNGRMLPKFNVSFPVTDNNVLYFNYGHSMKLPHPRFVYAGLDPEYADQSFLSRIGNPSLKPEATVSYELGIKSQLNKNLGISFTAFNNDKYDYIVTRTIVLKDQTGRLVDRTFNINQDYAKVVGVELGINQRIGKNFRAFFSGAYQQATGKSNSAAESALQIRQQGFVNTTKEQFLAWDRPWDLKLGVIFTPDTSYRIGKFSFNNFRFFLSSTYKSGLRYTPQELTGVTDLGRPIYQPINDQPFSEIGKAWFWTDLKISKDFKLAKKRYLSLSFEVQNIFNNKNSQIINPVTGRAYENGDPLPITSRDPNYPDPQDNGTPPNNPARYMQPRQILYGLSFKF